MFDVALSASRLVGARPVEGSVRGTRRAVRCSGSAGGAKTSAIGGDGGGLGGAAVLAGDAAFEAALRLVTVGGADDVTAATDPELVAAAMTAERVARAAMAQGWRVVAELARRRPAPSDRPGEEGLSEYAIDEISLALGVSRPVASFRVAEADALTGRLPKLLDALGAGVLSASVVRKVLDVSSPLDAAGCAQLQERLLTRLGRPDVADLGVWSAEQMAALPTPTVIAISARATSANAARIARDLVRRIDPDASRQRELTAKRGRRVMLDPGEDGMCWLGLHLPQAVGLAVWTRVDDAAHALSGDSCDERTLDAKRADVAVDLLLGGNPARPGAPLLPDADPEADGEGEGEVGAGTGTGTDAHVGLAAELPPKPVPVNLFVQLDHTGCTRGEDQGLLGDVARIGAVSADTVRDLLDLADTTGGSVTGAHALPQQCPGSAVHDRVGPGPYEPAESMKRFLRARHRRCVWPGCGRQARRCELDHTVRHPDGPTCVCNLAPACEHHHHLKHHAPGWRLVQHPGGLMEWTSPTGQRVTVAPDRSPP